MNQDDTKAKILWSESDSVKKIITRPIKNGKIILNKKAMIDIDKVPVSMLVTNDRNYTITMSMLALIISFMTVFVTYDPVITFIIMGCAMGGSMFFFRRKLIYPFYVATWYLNKPVNIDSVSSKTSKWTSKLKRNPKSKSLKDVAAEGEITFQDFKLKEGKGDTYSPESYKNLSEDAALKALIQGESKDHLNLFFGMMMLAVGMMIAVIMFPDGFNAFVTSFQQAAAQAPQAFTGAAGG
jgi:hypothetical protein